MEGEAECDPAADVLHDPSPYARSLAQHLAMVVGPATRAILHYGSRAQGRKTRSDSAFDFFILVDNYRQAYRVRGSRPDRLRRGQLAMVLAWLLPPNSAAIRQHHASGEREAKCIILSARHFRRECSRHARDHFVCGRLSQRVFLVWSRDRQSREEAMRGVREVREGCFDRVRVFLPPRFDLAQYCRALLDVSVAHEIRPDAKDYANTLFTAQRETLLSIHGPVLDSLCTSGRLARVDGAFVQLHPAGIVHRVRVRAWFRRSMVRTTLRLLKQPFLYDGWLDYLLRKIDRSTGEKIELNERERRWPLIFLWPRAFRYLRHRPQRRH
jgi:hypothetical protein